jgi:predicted DNA-binding protein (MmcQ/YjbR family)
MQDQSAVNRICETFPGAEVSQSFGPEHDCWKVGAKLFAVTGPDGTAVKTDSVETAALVIEARRGVRAPYFHASWILLPHGQVPDAELAERIATSYALIRAGLPKKVQATLA